VTFGVMLWAFKAGEALFHTGWFVESLATQVLVIFVIRTRGNPFRSRPAVLLTVTSGGVVVAASLLPFTRLAGVLGFVPLPPAFFGVLVLMVASYLVAAQVVKRWFYRHAAAPPGPIPRPSSTVVVVRKGPCAASGGRGGCPRRSG
jgi:Mg2+-importing ATPase